MRASWVLFVVCIPNQQGRGVVQQKGKTDDKLSWIVFQHEKLATLREKLHFYKELSKGKFKVEKMAFVLKVVYKLLESATNVVYIKASWPSAQLEQSASFLSISLFEH